MNRLRRPASLALAQAAAARDAQCGAFVCVFFCERDRGAVRARARAWSGSSSLVASPFTQRLVISCSLPSLAGLAGAQQQPATSIEAAGAVFLARCISGARFVCAVALC